MIFKEIKIMSDNDYTMQYNEHIKEDEDEYEEYEEYEEEDEEDEEDEEEVEIIMIGPDSDSEFFDSESEFNYELLNLIYD
jgi:hypothetical protein